jgi:uncharacterized surface protein with fasciclin (FAS1) repeats
LGVNGVEAIPVPTLRAVLLHHLAPGRRDSGSILAADRLRMLDGSFTRPGLVGGVGTIDGAPILASDVAASNGLIHVIGAVLLP